MRKITSFSSLLCALMFCTTAMAQVDDLANKGVKSIGTTSVNSLETGKWYVMENAGNAYAYDDVASHNMKHAAKSTLVTVGSSASECAKALFRITSSESSDDTKIGDVSAQKVKIQFGTGNYTKWGSFNSFIQTASEATDANTDVYAVHLTTGEFRFAKSTSNSFGAGANWMFDRAGAGVYAWSDGGGYSELTSNTGGANRLWKVYEVELVDRVDVTIMVKNEGDPKAKYTTENLKLPVGTTITLKDYVIDNGLVTYPNTTATVSANTEENTFTLTYSDVMDLPCLASSYEAVSSENKWVSFFTQNGRMHVFDDRCIYNNKKKNPTIDKATFASLADRYFWGIVCEDPFTSYVKIVNKNAGPGKTLYLSDGSNDTPVLFTNEEGVVPQSWIDNKKDEWIIEKGNKVGDIQYFCLKSKYDTNQRINNNALKGFMTTWNAGGTSDNGANIKFTPELETYQILKVRALDAPANATHSLTAEARKKITDYDNANESPTVDGYKDVITAINQMEHEGVIPFEDGGYYYLRNYTPAGENETYALASTDGTKANGVVIPNEKLGSNSVGMTYSNINAIWKISKADPNDNGYTGDSNDIGVSKSIGRHVTHVNSGKKLSSDISANNAQLDGSRSVFYFVNLGAGQHFMKNDPYDGTGNQAIDMPLGVKVNWSSNLPVLNSVNKNADGTAQLDKRYDGSAHMKNSHDTWYGIPVTSIDVTITDAGYATIYLPFGVTLPTGENTLEAYAVTAAGDGLATLTKVESIPANQGVILKGAANTTYTLTIDDKAAWEGITNLLSGSCMATKVKDDAYVLSKQGDEVGLYKAEKNQQTDSANDSWLNNDNKAYLPVSAVTNSSNGRFLSFNFDTVTGLDVIKGTESASSESVVYDLSGRRVRSAQKGLYIVNGKKVIK